MPRKRQKLPKKKCVSCSEMFTPKKGWQRFCRDGCRDDWHYERRKRAMELLKKEEGKDNAL